MEELDELCRERAQLLELKTIMTNTSLTSATEATAKVLRKGKINKTKYKSVQEASQQTTRREMRNISKAQKQAVKQTVEKRVRKNSSAGGRSPAPVATTNGRNGSSALSYTSASQRRSNGVEPVLATKKTRRTLAKTKKVSFSEAVTGPRPGKSTAAHSHSPISTQVGKRKGKQQEKDNVSKHDGQGGCSNGGQSGKRPQRK